MPKRGYGQFRKIANFLTINSVNVTQIFKGNRDLTVEQACLLCEYFGLSDLESEYFVGLVELERAGHYKLKKMIQKRLEEIAAKSQDLKKRLSSQGNLTDEIKSVFYSRWYYSAIRLSTSIDGFNGPDQIAKYFNLPLSVVNRTLEFLIATGLCEEKNGKVRMAVKSTHLEANSPFIVRHHTNWRLKALEKMEMISSDELCLSMPCSLSESSIKEVRKELVNAIERITDHIDKGPEEKLACLNIDWIKI